LRKRVLELYALETSIDGLEILEGPLANETKDDSSLDENSEHASTHEVEDNESVDQNPDNKSLHDVLEQDSTDEDQDSPTLLNTPNLHTYGNTVPSPTNPVSESQPKVPPYTNSSTAATNLPAPGKFSPRRT